MTWSVDQLDLRVAQRLGGLVGADDPRIVTLAALAAAAPRGGHVCVDLGTIDGAVVVERRPATGAGEGPEPEPLTELGEVEALLERAASSPLVGQGDDPGGATPLVIDGTRVYLDRYWTYEDGPPQTIRRWLRTCSTGSLRTTTSGRPSTASASRSPTGCCATSRLSPAVPAPARTHTVVSLLAAHVLLAEARDQRTPRIAIAAPTGKAAARLEEAMGDAVRDRGLPHATTAVLGTLQGHTLHRLLRWQRWSPTRFRHDRDNTLPHDVVVVDEASMVPLSLMAKLVAAVWPDAVAISPRASSQLARRNCPAPFTPVLTTGCNRRSEA